MTVRTWDRLLVCSVVASFAALYIAFKTGSYELVVAVTIAGIFIVLAIGGVWIYATASEPLGEPDIQEPKSDEPVDDVLAIADACASEHPDPLDESVPAEVAFADYFAAWEIMPTYDGAR